MITLLEYSIQFLFMELNLIDMNMSIGSMTSINGGGGLLSNQTIDEVSILIRISVKHVITN